MSEEDPKPASWHRNPFAPFKQEILEKIIAPKIVEIINLGATKSKADLLMKFKDAHQSGISMTTFDEWLSELGITFERVTKVNLPAGMTEPVKRQKMILNPQSKNEIDNDPVVNEIVQELEGNSQNAFRSGIVSRPSK